MHLFSIWFWLFAFFLTGLVANLITGSFSPEALWHGLVQQDPIMQQIFWELRLPRALLALSVGGLLAWAGMSMQSLFRNPLADPALIGVSAGAGAAAVSTLVLLSTSLPVQMSAAFLGALGILLLLYRLSTRDGITDLSWMLLAGIAINAMASALIGLSLYLASDEALRLLTWWLLGSFAEASLNTGLLLAAGLLILTLCTPLLARAQDAFLLGEESAWQMGIHTQHIKRLILLLTALVVGGAVASSGMIGFIGLVAPHIARQLTGSLHYKLAPASILTGMGLALWADAAARWLAAPSELPVGLLLSAMGGPFFLWLLIRMRRHV